jgi:hypothetical protein
MNGGNSGGLGSVSSMPMSGVATTSVPSRMNRWTGRLSVLRSDTPTPKNREPAGAPKTLKSLATSSIGPPWHVAQMPLVDPSLTGTSSNMARPRFSEAVTPRGS